MMMVKSVGVQKNDDVLLIGASGGIGSYLYQMLISLEANVIILSSERSRNYTQMIFPDAKVVTKIKDVDNKSIKFVLDTAGNESLLNQSESKLLDGGTLFTSALPTYHKLRLDIHSVFNNLPISPKQYKKIIEMLSKGTLKAQINKVFEMNDVKLAQHYEDETASRGRIVLKIND
ncbi:bifunctional protein: zinc-containing alcohol dehydrogenase, quinone oxidoreductase [Lentilactobacillus kosonis]|uniref:Bifunctional protein: zinc-containing alcohol dehydrogenase, quinone oxidoreductase n=2 Tax=Lentilactobacillus kosonis TaxID=2810561 RepID=A0A401FHU6_9LACO|nr:bifunctional protein: zinc-containing alcohol dehydrogenase, quinone oxidoreductase [Lentilactobacillus kosonis]